MLQFLIALDQLLNALLGGWADDALSARAFRLHGRKRGWFIAILRETEGYAPCST